MRDHESASPGGLVDVIGVILFLVRELLPRFKEV